jgi:curved DNA-binding protein CbpA
VYPKAATVLAAREGDLAATPLPLLLQALHAEGRTVTLELKLRGLEKRIQFEDGSPVACRSNLLHETLGKFLVAKGKLTEPQYLQALADSAASGQRMGELLVSQGRLAPFDLYRLMQANLAMRLLEAFRWGEARWRLSGDAEPAELALKMNPAQLVLTGVCGFLPFEVVASQLAFTDEQRFALVARPPHDLAKLKLDPREARLVSALKRRPTFEEARAGAGLEVEDALRRLYALTALGFVDFAEAVPERPAAAAGPPPTSASPPVSEPASDPAQPTQPPPPPSAPADPEESEELRNALASDWLAHRGKDPFDLLGVPPAADAAEARLAFLALADRFSPLRFRSADLREKAEGLLAARARAYGALADGELAGAWRRRRAAAEERARAPARPATAEQFRIQTDLLDAATQFAEGRRRLAADDRRGALEYFQYAADIEPTALHRAHLAWARFLVDPARHARLALGELGDVARREPGCADAHRFTGEILRAERRFAEAEEAFRHAARADPSDQQAQRLALEMLRARKAAER